MTPHWLAHALYILDAIETLDQATEKGFEYLFTDNLTYRGAVQAIQTLAESTYKLPDDIKADHSDIPWVDFRELRNNFAHDYLVCPTQELISHIINHYLPPLKAAMMEHVPNWDEIKHEHRYI
ncbi:MAG: HepT-like ribonuclease domain-containing protein [Cyanobacteria bacterium P01_A01_bin.17]